jgi:hypothetical protein
MFSDVGAFLNKLMTSSRLIKSFVIWRALTVTTKTLSIALLLDV